MKSNEGCSSLAGVIAFALTRPHWGRSNQIRLQKMSLREWPLVFQSFTQMLQSPAPIIEIKLIDDEIQKRKFGELYKKIMEHKRIVEDLIHLKRYQVEIKRLNIIVFHVAPMKENPQLGICQIWYR